MAEYEWLQCTRMELEATSLILDVATCHFDRKTVPAQCQKDQWASQPGFLAEPRMEMVHAHEIGLAGPVIRIIGQCYY